MTLDVMFDRFIARYEDQLGSEHVGSLLHFAKREAHPGTPKAAADSLCRSLNLRALGDAWIDLEWDIPRHSPYRTVDPASHLARWLEKTMAYAAPWFAPQQAEQLAFEFYALFSRGRTIRLTNGLGNGWTPVTDATLDRVHIAMDDEFIGLIGAWDED